MEFLIELLVELILDGCINISSNKKISKVVRYPLIGIIIILFLSVVFLIMFCGVIMLPRNLFIALFFIIIGIIFLIFSIKKFKTIYMNKKLL